MPPFVIFANGDVTANPIEIPPDAFVMAADGGARHCLATGITPHLVIGDFDSLTKDEISKLKAKGASLVRYPADKDETDLELALEYALNAGGQNITLYGLLGGRWDMSFANLLLLAAPRFSGVQCRVIAGERAHILILRGGETLKLQGQTGDTVSVLPIHGDVHGLTYRGLKWSLKNADLDFGSPRGVSNTFTGSQAMIRLEAGVALVFVQFQETE
jgi:thiamine pyrophosphokinase